MFRMAFHHIDLNARYPLMKKIMFSFGFQFFQLSVGIIHGIKR